MQRNCEKINHRWFHYDKFVNRVGKMSDLQGIFIILPPRIADSDGTMNHDPTHVKVRFRQHFPQQSMSCDENIQSFFVEMQ